MVRTASLVLLFGSLNLMAQTPTVIPLLASADHLCGPIVVQARMLDTSQDRPVEPHQKVGITLKNLKSTPIVLERITAHFGSETPTSGAPFEMEHKVEVDGKQQAFFVEAFSGSNSVTYIELNSVRYADGSSWQPSTGAVCEINPEPLKN